ncbi:MAG: hypothetical protein QW304_06895 [Thermoproteota archaeon]
MGQLILRKPYFTPNSFILARALPEDQDKTIEEALKFKRKWLKISIILTSFLFLPLGILIVVVGINMGNIIVFILGFMIAIGIPFSIAIIIGRKYEKMLWGELYYKVINTIYKNVWEVVPDYGRRMAKITTWSLLIIALIIMAVTLPPRGNPISLIVYIAALLMLIAVAKYFLGPEINEFLWAKEEAYMQELEALRLELTPEEKKRFNKVYKILFPSYDAKRKEEE